MRQARRGIVSRNVTPAPPRALAGSALPSLAARPVGELATEAGAKAVAHETKHLAVEVAKHVGEDLVADGVHHAAEHGAHALGGHDGHASASAHAEAHAPPTPSSGAAPGQSSHASGASAPAGRSGTRAVSEPAHEPAGKSEASPAVGLDAIPYLPGHAPARIPEMRGPVRVVLQG